MEVCDLLMEIDASNFYNFSLKISIMPTSKDQIVSGVCSELYKWDELNVRKGGFFGKEVELGLVL